VTTLYVSRCHERLSRGGEGHALLLVGVGAPRSTDIDIVLVLPVG
jgi:hypothetical protein